ncbi:Hypothetical protein AA314_08473 [Archangium gephyra]|uniref:Uncharacterized protein n=1 Tax=Archangium gephyra TaxID=48 RepID=A0AAC8QFH0_9BACT|nr:Hypothetical protein AA314_08473 [Archangium gephyra]
MGINRYSFLTHSGAPGSKPGSLRRGRAAPAGCGSCGVSRGEPFVMRSGPHAACLSGVRAARQAPLAIPVKDFHGQWLPLKDAQRAPTTPASGKVNARCVGVGRFFPRERQAWRWKITSRSCHDWDEREEPPPALTPREIKGTQTVGKSTNAG